MTEPRLMRGLAVACCTAVALLTFSSVGTAKDAYIAGSKPFERPAGAPVIKSAPPVAEQVAKLPSSLKGAAYLLKDQGNWYTPFTRPGMLAKYDIWGWHKGKNAAKTAALADTKRS